MSMLKSILTSKQNKAKRNNLLECILRIQLPLKEILLENNFPIEHLDFPNEILDTDLKFRNFLGSCNLVKSNTYYIQSRKNLMKQ